MNDLIAINAFLFWLNLIIIVLIGLMMVILPTITRKAMLFGNRVPESAAADPAVRALKRSFAVRSLVLTLVVSALAVWQYSSYPDYTLIAMLYLPLLLALMMIPVYIPCWRRASRLKAERGWDAAAMDTLVPDIGRPREQFGGVLWGWYIGSAALALLTAVLSTAIYPQLPETLITHWNGAMQADGWAAKSYGLILLVPIFSVAMTGFMLLMNRLVYRMKLQISQDMPALSHAQHRVYRRLLSHMLGLITLIITLLFLFFQPMILNLWVPSGTILMLVILIVTVLMIIPAILLSILAGQSGNKLQPQLTPADFEAAGQIDLKPDGLQPAMSDDQFWKLGLFYYNSEDDALLVEDRFGNNGGLNYARPAAKIIVGGLVLTLVITYVFCTVLFLSLV